MLGPAGSAKTSSVVRSGLDTELLVGDVDLSTRIEAAKGPMFEPLHDVAYFARVSVDRELGTVVWPNGVDLAPDVLHEQALNLT